MATVIIIFDSDRAEIHEVKNDSDAEYWIHRRIEKEGREATAAYIVERKLDVEKIVAKFYARRMKYEAEIRETNERVEYERLKQKFEPST